MNCNQSSYGNLKGVLCVPTFSHIMSDKIRKHYLKRFFEQTVVSDKNTVEMLAMNCLCSFVIPEKK